MTRLACLVSVVFAMTLGCSQGPAPVSPPAQSTSSADPHAAPQSGETTSPSSQVPASNDSNQGTASVANNNSPVLEVPAADGTNWLTRDEISEGWIRLFDGHTLFGWKSNGKLGWSVQDGVITADSRDAADQGLLVSTTRFADYELRCDYRLEAGGNSGLFLRTPVNPTDPAVDCYELNMCDSKPTFATASLVKRANPTKPILGDGEWHSFFVRLEGPRIVIKFDNEPVLEYTDETERPLETGHIGLQMNGGKIEFRNVFLKPLGAKPLFNGTSLDGWHEVPGSKSQFTVENESIHVVNGRGFLETDATAGNFVLQFDAITNGDKLNSGIFFRAMRGTEQAPSHGYEFQIHNGFQDGDRTRPDDHGTGGIFKRVSARRVVSNDREWLTATLIADGPHIATWVDGIQVVDWTDARAENENPREGLRVAPGHLSLQGHDPTTDLAFRHLRLVETPR